MSGDQKRGSYGKKNKCHDDCSIHDGPDSLSLFYASYESKDCQKKNNYPKYVITLDELVTGTDDSGIRIVHLKDFLLKENL